MERTHCRESELSCMAVTNQRETAMIWDRTNGKPVYNAIIWQCQRGVEFCNHLKEENPGKLIQDITGLIHDPYFSTSKFRWIVEHVEGVREKMEKCES
jgi:glycerol kinase